MANKKTNGNDESKAEESKKDEVGDLLENAPPKLESPQPESGEAMPHTPPTAETKEPEKPAEGIQEDPPVNSAPHKMSQNAPPRPKCGFCGSEAVGVAGGLRRCNQCGQTWH